MRFESESFSKLQHCIPMGQKTYKGFGIKNVFTTLFCQLSRPNLKQHRLPPTSQRSQGTACCRTTSRVQPRNRLGWECLSRSRLSGFLTEFCLAGYLGNEGTAWHFISWPSKILSQRTASTRLHLQHPDSSPQRCDVNANDISAMANM